MTEKNSLPSRTGMLLAALLVCLYPVSVPGMDSVPHLAIISTMDDPEEWEGEIRPEIATCEGHKCLRFDLGQGGQFKWRLKNFKECGIDLEQYQALQFDYRIEGGQARIRTEMRQWPWMGGYACLFYQDTLPAPQGVWLTDTALQPENAWRSSWSKDQDFLILEIADAKADPGKNLFVYIDELRVLRHRVTVDCVNDIFFLPGQRKDEADGSLKYFYPLTVRNHTNKPMDMELSLDTCALKLFHPSETEMQFSLPPHGNITIPLVMQMNSIDRKKAVPFYSEPATVSFTVKGDSTPEFVVNLLPAVPQSVRTHPYLISSKERLRKIKIWKEKYGWVRSAWNQYLQRADFALKLPHCFPEYRPRQEQPEDRMCSRCQGKTILRRLDPDLPAYRGLSLAYRYQCVGCGNMLSRYQNDSHMGERDNAWWTPASSETPPAHAIGFNKHGNLLDLAIAWHLTGEEKYRDKASSVLREYLRVLPGYPFKDASMVEFGIGGKGHQKLGGYFSQNEWLQMVACTMDLLWDSGALTVDERTKLLAELKKIFLNRLRLRTGTAHRVNEGGAALASLCDDASLQVYLLYDPFQGAIPDLRRMFGNDGFCLMAGQYIEPVIIAWLDVLELYRNMGLNLGKEVPALKRFPLVMQQWLDPDGFSPAMGDAASFSPLKRLYWFEMFFNWYQDPLIIAPVRDALFKQWEKASGKVKWEDLQRHGAPGNRSCAALLRCSETIPFGKGDPPCDSYVFPDYGLLVLNHGEGKKRLWAAIPYGQLLGHGFFDNLHLEWWAMGQKQTIRTGARGRLHAVNHNTLLVDGLNQNKIPAEISWFRNHGDVHGAVLSSSLMYPGVDLQRCIMLYDGLIFLFDYFDGKQNHYYDMIYANAGQPHCNLEFKPLESQLVLDWKFRSDRAVAGQVGGYSLLLNAVEAPAPEILTITWNQLRSTSAHMRLTQMSTGNQGTVYRANAPFEKNGFEALTSNPANVYNPWPSKLRGERPEIMGVKFIRRIRADKVGLLTILEPYEGDSPVIRRIERLPLKLDGQEVSTQGIGIKYQDDAGKWHGVIMCPLSGVKTAGSLKTSAAFDAGVLK
ncbi:MAG: hypothetical protein JXR78_02955 [Victivallales bacterium]|nr:hypothetical protein [Victivallales bacterium]